MNRQDEQDLQDLQDSEKDSRALTDKIGGCAKTVHRDDEHRANDPVHPVNPVQKSAGEGGQDEQDLQDEERDSRALTEKIIGCAMAVHRVLGSGFLESVYQNALVHELSKAGLTHECGRRIPVHYDGVIVGDFVADIVVHDSILIENKAVTAILPAHEVQIVNYLTATGIEIGLLLNFGADRLQFKRKTRTFRPKRTASIVGGIL